jgi:nucleotide-binding universal stress UspA family protein
MAPIKRVVVPLDTTSETQTAIDTASRLAAHWRVPLHGVFIEDEELLCLAGLPFGCQFSLTAGREPLTKSDIEDHFRAFAERARRDLAAAARRLKVEWSFEVVRGPLAIDAFEAAEHDFVVAGAVTRPLGSHFQIASHWWSSIVSVARPFLLARREWETGGSVLAVLNHRTPGSARTLDLAAQLAELFSGRLTVAGPPDLVGSDEFENWVSVLLQGLPLALQTEPAVPEPAALRQRIFELDCRVLVLEAGTAAASPDRFHRELANLSCDLLVVN